MYFIESVARVPLRVNKQFLFVNQQFLEILRATLKIHRYINVTY